ncbi:hypothetical protein XH92_36330 [Bradyrhizobium sp. CCBAU 53421]|nr:hypothetical protein XH92_36330 [Bradyrhizobium sp. CCBAU 53421]
MNKHDTKAAFSQDKLWSARRKRKLQYYGAPVGMLGVERLTMDDPFDRPYPPGSSGNASTFSVPVRYRYVKGLKFATLLDLGDKESESMVVEAAKELDREGAQLITANCGFMIRYQEAVRAAVDVPVLLSPLLLIPLLEQMLPSGRTVGIITAKASALAPDFLEAAGLRTNFHRLAIAGLESAPVFSAAVMTASGDFDFSAVEAETVNAALTLLEARPDIGAFLLECSELPPFAAAVQRATGVPVFDFTSMVEFFVAGLRRKVFIGID